MNWYKRARKYEDERFEGEKIDTQLLCCGYPENRREPYKKKKAQVIERDKHIKAIVNIMQKDNWVQFGRYIDFLRAQGYEETQIDFIINRANQEFRKVNRKEAQMGRGRYRGQDPGDLYRGRGAVDQDFFDTNERELGEHVNTMRELMKIQDSTLREARINSFVQELRDKGYAMPIIQKLIITPAMYRFKVK